MLGNLPAPPKSENNTSKPLVVFKIGTADREKMANKNNRGDTEQEWFDMIRMCHDAYFKKYGTGDMHIQTFWRKDTLYGIGYDAQTIGFGYYRDEVLSAAETDLDDASIPEAITKFGFDNRFSIPDDPKLREAYRTFATLLGEERRAMNDMKDAVIKAMK